MTMQHWIEVLTALTGAFGFCLIFGLHGKQLPVASIGSALTWLVCIGGELLAWPLFWSLFAAALFGSVYSAVAARLLKIPKTAFFISVLIALIPGGSLYHTMRHALDGNMEQFFKYGMETVLSAFAIASGMILVLVADATTRHLQQKKHRGK